MKHILAICDGEREYAYLLAEYMKDKKKLPYEIQVFSSKEGLRDFTKINVVEVLLIAESLFDEEMEVLPIANKILLNESGIISRENIVSIYKYQTSETIAKEILQVLIDTEAINNVLGMGEKLQVIGVYSPVKRCLQTSFSFVLGQVLSKKHKVLYINLEMYSGLGQMLQKNFSTDLSDLIYYMQNSNEKLNHRVNGMVETVNQLDIMPPFLSYLDLMSVSKEEWLMLFQEISNCCDYEYLILDLSEGVQSLFSILQECHIIYTLTREDRFAMSKIEQYEMLLQQCQYEDILTKTKKHTLPIFKKLPKGIEQLQYSELAVKVKEWIKEDFYE